MHHPLRYLAAVAALLAVAIGAPLVAALRHERDPAPAVSAASLARDAPAIARRVERIRELRFERVPRPRVVDVERFVRIYEREARRSGAAGELRRDELTLRLLGLLDPDEGLEGLSGAIAEDVAGAYDPRRGRLYVTRDAIPESAAAAEVTLAHELTHALEDQAFGLREPDGLPGDRGLALQALVEGTATAVMFEYAVEEGLLADLFGLDPGDSALEVPGVVRAQLLFAYLRGFTFVDRLRRLGRDWDLVNIALRERPPLSSEHILHPLAYLRRERPLPVRADGRARLGGAWRRLDAEDVGEFDTLQLLQRGNDERAAREAAAGWGGGRFELWRRRDCEGPVAHCHALLAVWRSDSRRDAAQLRRALRTYVEAGREGRRAAAGVWRLPGGGAAIDGGGDRTRLALAPSVALAAKLGASRTPARRR